MHNTVGCRANEHRPSNIPNKLNVLQFHCIFPRSILYSMTSGWNDSMKLYIVPRSFWKWFLQFVYSQRCTIATSIYMGLCAFVYTLCRYWISFMYCNKFYSYKFHIYVLFSIPFAGLISDLMQLLFIAASANIPSLYCFVFAIVFKSLGVFIFFLSGIKSIGERERARAGRMKEWKNEDKIWMNDSRVFFVVLWFLYYSISSRWCHRDY